MHHRLTCTHTHEEPHQKIDSKVTFLDFATDAAEDKASSLAAIKSSEQFWKFASKAFLEAAAAASLAACSCKRIKSWPRSGTH